MPTLSAENYGTNQGGGAGRVGKVRPSLETMARTGNLPTLTTTERGHALIHGLFPTLRASDGEKGGPNQRGSKGDLGLPAVVARLPTLTTQDAKNNGWPEQAERRTPALNSVIGGALNPEWAEWYMGFPIGYTGLEPLETARFREWLRKHGCA